ncbi:hypothetical protein [Sphingomonas sp. RS2018]
MPPPPVIQTAPPPAATVPAEPAPAPEAQAPAATTDTGASRTTIAPGALDVVDDARIAAQREAQARSAPRSTPRQAPARPAAERTATPAPVAVAPAPAAVPVVATPEPVAPPAAAPAALPAEATTATAPDLAEPASGFPLWPVLLVAGLLLVGAIGYRVWSRRRDREHDRYYDETAYADQRVAEEPVVSQRYEETTAPVPAAFVAPTIAAAHHDDVAVAHAEDVTVADAGADDVAALTDADAPVTDRPWLEFAMRPVRIGSSDDEAVVEIELTVANSGSMPAQDVRVSTFMLADARGSDMESLLIDRPADAAVDAVTIAPGEGTRIDATLAAPKADVGTAHFRPVVVADARYRLADGTEGRTSASFMVGVTQGDGIGPIELDDAGMRDDVEARLHGEPLHA